MPDEGRLPRGPRRDLVAALHELYVLAGKPPCRQISAHIRKRDDLPGTLSHEGVSAVLRGTGGVPRWLNLKSLVHALVDFSITDLDVVAQVERIHKLWSAADEPVNRAAELPSASTDSLLPPARTLPAVLPAADVADTMPDVDTVTLGLFEHDHSPAVLDLFGRDQHLLALGDRGTGKTNLLRLIVDRLLSQHSKEDLVFAVFDPRRGLGDVVPEPYLGGRATNPAMAQQLATAVCEELGRRELAASKPSLPRIVLLIDDYDILSTSGTQPLGAFLPYLAYGSDIGLHVLMTRRVIGASRGLYEPFTLGVRESGCLGLLMSGDATEGQLFAGVRPSTLPIGRAQLIRPGEAVQTMQTALLERED